MDCIALARSMPAYEAGDYEGVRRIVAVSVERLAAAGAEFFVCPDNTVHQALALPGADLALPGLHIAEVVADNARRRGFSRVGILGTRYLMQGPVYQEALRAQGIDVVVPEEDDQATIHSVIFDQLLHGVVDPTSRERFLAIIDRLAQRGCDAVALVCTEIPMLITREVSPLPTLDSTRLLARAAFGAATGTEPWPTWHGGPVR